MPAPAHDEGRVAVQGFFLLTLIGTGAISASRAARRRD
jgi:hypothetical protein